MVKNDYNTAGIENTTGKDINTGYNIIEEIDDKTKDITYDILCDGKLVFSCLTKPLCFAWIEGHKTGSEDEPSGSRSKQTLKDVIPDNGGTAVRSGPSDKEKQGDENTGNKTPTQERTPEQDDNSGANEKEKDTGSKAKAEKEPPVKLRKMI